MVVPGGRPALEARLLRLVPRAEAALSTVVWLLNVNTAVAFAGPLAVWVVVVGLPTPDC